MPPLFLPEIETLADENPLMYEILFRIQQAITSIPLSSGGVTPSPTPATDPNTGLPLTDATGNPLFTIPQDTNPSDASLPSAQVPANENGLFISTDPTGEASGLYMFGGVWQPIAKVVRASDLAGHGTPAKTFLTPGAVAIQGLQFDDHGRPTSSFFTNALDNTGAPLTQPLTQNGVTTKIDIASTTWQFGGFQVTYNSGSVDPGIFGTFNIYFDDQQFNGGVVVYKAAAVGDGTVLKKRGRFFLGVITTAGGGGGTGGGGGSGGGGGGVPR